MNVTLTSVNLGSVEKIPAGQGRCYKVLSEEIAVFRQRDGRLFAIQNRCPHRQGPLSEGIIGEGKVICPLHSHKFDLHTGRGSEPVECVRTFVVQEINGEVHLQIENNPATAPCPSA
jgi:nitrite reductase (NADH) small subunit